MIGESPKFAMCMGCPVPEEAIEAFCHKLKGAEALEHGNKCLLREIDRRALRPAELNTEFTVGKCSVRMQESVYVEIKGTPHPDGFPALPDDGGLVLEMRQWMEESQVYPMKALSVGGGGFYAILLRPEAAELLAWLEDREERGEEK